MEIFARSGTSSKEFVPELKVEVNFSVVTVLRLESVSSTFIVLVMSRPLPVAAGTQILKVILDPFVTLDPAVGVTTTFAKVLLEAPTKTPTARMDARIRLVNIGLIP